MSPEQDTSLSKTRSDVKSSIEERTDAVSAASPWRHALGLWIVVGLFTLIGIARSIQVGIGFRDPSGGWLAIRLAYTIVLFGIFVVLDAWLRTTNRNGRRGLVGSRSVSDVVATIRLKWTRNRLALAAAALAAYHVTYFVYHNLKSWDVFLESKDQMLLDLDRWLFFGNSPHEMLHNMFGTGLSAYVIRDWYEIFGSIVIVAFPACVVFADRIKDAFACISAFVWVWMLGTLSYYLIPTQGPFLSAPGEFTSLPHLSIQDTQQRYAAQREQLLANPHGEGLYAQISAFASLHVGVTAVILGVAWWYGMRRTTTFMTIFLLGTMVATVYLGWHFAVDVPAGLLIAAMAWWLGPRTVGVRHSERSGLRIHQGVGERI